MDNLKQQIIEQFSKEIALLDFNQDIHTLEIKYNTIVENLRETIKIKKEKYQVPLHKTSNDNILFDEINLCAGKSSETVLNDSTKDHIKTQLDPINTPTTIPSNFSLTFEMIQYAKSKYVQNIEDVFEHFKVHCQSKGITNTNWEAAWKKWVLNQSKYTNHLVKTTIDENLELKDFYMQTAKKYLPTAQREIEFLKFKNHYLANGDLRVSWEKVWENWCINFKKFQPMQTSSPSKEHQAYKWNFKKAKEVSDKIKDWLEFEKGINWLDDFYWKGINIPGIGWQKVAHPDFNKDEILLYKIDSSDGQHMLQYQTQDTIDVEVLEDD